MNKTANHVAVKKQYGAGCQGMGETLKRWEEWAKECFRKDQDSLKPRIEHITEGEWENDITKPPENLYEIRKHAGLTQIMNEEPEIETLLNQDYKEQDIGIELRNIPNRKSHGNDGIPGEAYKATRQWEITTIAKTTNIVKNGRPIPDRWTEGAIVYIYKIKEAQENVETTDQYASRR